MDGIAQDVLVLEMVPLYVVMEYVVVMKIIIRVLMTVGPFRNRTYLVYGEKSDQSSKRSGRITPLWWRGGPIDVRCRRGFAECCPDVARR